jgi:protein-tyrosine-phosphatase
MAEALIRSRIEASGLVERMRVASMGTWVLDPSPPTTNAVAAMAERGLDITDHVSREVDAAALTAVDLVLVMTDGHRAAIETEFPDARGKTRLISSLAGGTWDIADPIGGSLDDYRVTAAELARLIDAGWDTITGAE